MNHSILRKAKKGVQKRVKLSIQFVKYEISREHVITRQREKEISEG